MANKPLKSIKFPELPDTYTIPQVDLVPTQGSTNAVSSGGVWSALQNIDVSTDTTLSVSGKPADAKAVGNALAEKVNAVSGKGLSTNDYTDAEKQKVADAGEYGEAIQILNDNVLSYTEMTPAFVENNWKIRSDVDDGRVISDSAYKSDRYAVTSGELIRVVSDYRFQFQNAAPTRSALPTPLVGEVYNAGTYILTVPETATFLIVSALKESTTAHAYSVSGLKSRVDDIEPKVDALEENADITETRLDATTQLTDGDSPQLFDRSQYPVYDYGTSYNYYNNCYIDFKQNGKYYINPIGKALTSKAYAYDENDNLLTYNGSSSNQYFNWGAYGIIERVDDTHIKYYVYADESAYRSGTIRQIFEYEYNGVIAKLKFQFFRNLHYGDSVKYGITYGKPYEIYIPYGKNLTYNHQLYDDTWENFVEENRFYDVPAKRLNPWMQRSYALTDNLLDDRKINWVGSGNYYSMKPGETVPVEGGKTIICNKSMYVIKTYDSNGIESTLANTGQWKPITLASDVVAIRFSVWRGNGGDYAIPIDEYNPIYLYYADDTLYPLDDVDRLPAPMAQINGWDINKNVYDYAIPEVDSNIVRMMKTFAIRELNHQRDAFRIGTFNIYVNNTRTNRHTIKTELETYGIDMCCFQEARNLTDDNKQLNIGDYLKRGWQFAYCNTNEATVTNGRSIVSRYEILSSEEVIFTDNTDNSYLKCVIQLPRYKDYADGLTTLSLYTYHGNVASATTRTAEVTQMLQAIAQDTSDFIVVTGDTNDFSENKDVWAQFQVAGLTPVHDGKSETVTARNNSIDNIFVSSGITCLYYDVINSSEWQYKPLPTSSPIPVSDHDFLYADLQFDFDAVIEARNQAGT